MSPPCLIWRESPAKAAVVDKALLGVCCS
jgi:hypothetical protein